MPIRALFHRFKKILLDIYPPHFQSAPEHDAPPNTYSVPPAVAKPWPHRGEGGDAATIVDHWLATVSKLLRSLKQCGPDEKETPAALSFRLVKKAFRIKFSKQHRGESNPGKEEMGGGRALRVRRTTKIAADSQLAGDTRNHVNLRNQPPASWLIRHLHSSLRALTPPGASRAFDPHPASHSFDPRTHLWRCTDRPRRRRTASSRSPRIQTPRAEPAGRLSEWPPRVQRPSQCPAPGRRRRGRCRRRGKRARKAAG